MADEQGRKPPRRKPAQPAGGNQQRRNRPPADQSAAEGERPARRYKPPRPGQAPKKGPSLTVSREDRQAGIKPKRAAHGTGSRGFGSVVAGGRRRTEQRLSGDGELFNRYHADTQWPDIQETATEGLVLVNRLLLEGLHELGWQEVRVQRRESPDLIFGFDNVWTLRDEAGRETGLAPDECYRDLLYLAPGFERDGSGSRELDRSLLGKEKLLDQKARLVVRKRLARMVEETEAP